MSRCPDSTKLSIIFDLFANELNNKYNFNFSGAELESMNDTCINHDNFKLCYKPLLPLDTINECEKYLINIAVNNAHLLYQQYIDSVIYDFEQRYIEKCLSAFEIFTMEYTEREYHYTLYYYSQADNLIKTIPPAGIKPLTKTEVLNASKHRANPQQEPRIMPSHKLITNYKYNTLNKIVQQYTPDGGISRFWYDALGRLIISQNEEQKLQQTYTYIIYDKPGRIIETGEIKQDSLILPKTASSPALLTQWLNVPHINKTQITHTFYDTPLKNNIPDLIQTNLRNRVTSITYEDTNDGDSLTYNSATHYSYDIHGNVKTLVQELPSLEGLGVGQSFKRINYKYDLVSGNVNEVHYQPGKPDQFYHRYEYDADNRLTNVYTSKNNIVWERDAKYFYYKHGPLSRAEIGDLKVQGIDYAYTIHGWMKGVNSNTMQANRDIGNDGETNISNPNKMFPRDAFGYTLGYYDGDYKSINTFPTTNRFNALTTASDLQANRNDLFNGNISSMQTAIPSPAHIKNELIASIQGTAYKYDQLNRISQMKAFNNIDISGNKWLFNNNKAQTKYQLNLDYDPNGNIKQLTRMGNKPDNLGMDSLTYHYYTNSNKLEYVDDDVKAHVYTNDIDAQNKGNYKYDETGSLIRDEQEEIDTIQWTLSGKVKKVIRTKASQKPDLEFAYGPDGNRVLKIVKPGTSGKPAKQEHWLYTYYVRDASGNIMATYTLKYEKQGGIYKEKYMLNEHILYGSNTLGIRHDTILLSERTFTVNKYNTDGSFASTNNIKTEIFNNTDETHISHKLGLKQYELSNHLGNVLVTVSDRKIPVKDKNNPTTIKYYEPDVLSINDYYPFGMTMQGRSFNTASYKFGFNGKEGDNEIKGNGNSYSFGARMLDTRLCRWLTVDPLAADYPYASPYSFVLNTPLSATDPDGKLVMFIGGLRLLQAQYDQIPLLGGGGIYSSDVFDYWAINKNSFGKKVDMAGSFMKRIGDYNAYYTSGSSYWDSQASDREKEGAVKAKTFHKNVQSGEIVLKPGETIKIVSHSQGGAHSAGFATELLKYKDADGNPLYNIEIMYYITPHQPEDINHPKSILAKQYSHPDDAVSSEAPFWMPNGGSKLAPIKGIKEYRVTQELKSTGAGYYWKDGKLKEGNRGQHNSTDNKQILDIPKGKKGYVEPRKDIKVPSGAGGSW